MADQKRWFKVWTSITSDDDFDPSRLGGLLSLGRFSILGAYTALHGEHGVVEIMPDTLFRLLDVTDLVTVRNDLAFKNVSFEEGKNRHGKITVTWAKWVKYQEDSTQAERQKTSRSKRRREEIRREEIRREEREEYIVEKISTSPPSQVSGNNHLAGEAVRWLDELNRLTDKNFRPVESTLQTIVARIKEGYTYEQAERVIRNRWEKWAGDEKMEEFLRPSTLFRKTKFPEYLTEALMYCDCGCALKLIDPRWKNSHDLPEGDTPDGRPDK